MKFDISKLKKGKFVSKLRELSANELQNVLGGRNAAMASCSVTSSSSGCESTAVCNCTPLRS